MFYSPDTDTYWKRSPGDVREISREEYLAGMRGIDPQQPPEPR